MKEPSQIKGLKKDLKPLGLHYQIHLANGPQTFQKSISLIVQGRNESTQMYEHLISAFTEKNDKDLFLYDLRGQGESKGIRAHIDSFQDYIKDLETIVVALRKIYQTVHLITHSTGGLIATLFATLNQEKLGKGGTLSLISPFLGLKSTGVQHFLVNKKLSTVSQTYDALFRFFPKLKLRRFEFSKTDNFRESSLTTDPTFFRWVGGYCGLGTCGANNSVGDRQSREARMRGRARPSPWRSPSRSKMSRPRWRARISRRSPLHLVLRLRGGSSTC